MEISQHTWSRHTVILSGRVMGQFGGSLEPSTPMEFLCQSAFGPTSHIENQDVRS